MNDGSSKASTTSAITRLVKHLDKLDKPMPKGHHRTHTFNPAYRKPTKST